MDLLSALKDIGVGGAILGVAIIFWKLVNKFMPTPTPANGNGESKMVPYISKGLELLAEGNTVIRNLSGSVKENTDATRLLLDNMRDLHLEMRGITAKVDTFMNRQLTAREAREIVRDEISRGQS